MKIFWLKCKRRLLSVQVDNLKILKQTKGYCNPKLEQLMKDLEDLNNEIFDLTQGNE